MEWLVLPAAVVALFGVLVLAGVLYQMVGSRRDRSRYPPTGRLVEVSSHRQHIHCLGRGSPVVVFDSALAASSLSWWQVQPQVARFTRTLSYDRAASGWSEAGPLPRTVDRLVQELRLLLKASGENPPYVLVGHCYGGLTLRLYASRYPGEVAGMILVDPADPKEWLNPDAERGETLEVGARMARRGALLARLGVARLMGDLAACGALSRARQMASWAGLGILQAQETRLVAPLAKLPLKLRLVGRTFWTRPEFFEALASQIEHLPAGARQVDAIGDHGDVPLVVLTAAESPMDKRRAHQAMAALSSSGRHLLASTRSHWIPLEEPQLVIRTVQEVVEEARRKSRSS